jgi:hypothetical protein
MARSQQRTRSRRGTECQGGSLRHGATFYGDNILNHYYDGVAQELGYNFRCSDIQSYAETKLD